MENIVAAKFEVEAEGYKAITELRNSPVTSEYAVSAAMLAKKENGVIRQLDAFDTGMETADDTAYGGLVGGLIGIIGGPLGMLIGGSMGALMGSMVDMDDSAANVSLIEKVMEVFDEGEVALIALVQELQDGALDRAIDRTGADILKLDAVEVAEEIRQAQEIQKQMAKEAKKQLRAEKKAEHKENNAARREKMKEHFEKVKDKFHKKDKDAQPSEG